MCGICGIFHLHAPATDFDPPQALKQMLARMHHRGPDGAGMVDGEWGALGANRLAIRGTGDPHPSLLGAAGGIWVACNGEIDNHRQLRERLRASGHDFSLQTDVEVIAPLYMEYGLDFAQHLSGAFAIALWDPHRARLILARDRAGERYIHFAIEQGRLMFATELAALRAGHSRVPQINVASVARYLSHGFYPAMSGPFAGCQKVAPGEMIIVDKAGVQRRDYHKPPPVRHASGRGDDSRFDRLFRASIWHQTDVDVDYGVLLSGGLDSSLITAVARTVRPDKYPTAYGLRFAERSFDEGDVAERVASGLGCRYVPVMVHAHELPGTLRDLVRTCGEPLADPAWVPMSLLAARAAREVRLVLAGEGADELFGGYPTYLGAQLARRYGALPAPLRCAFGKVVAQLPVSDKKMTISFLLKRFVQGQELAPYARHLLWTANISPLLMRQLGVEPMAVPPSPPQAHVLDMLQRQDQRHALAEALLAKADRGGMRHGLEVRAPFLDPRIIEFASSLSPAERVSGLTTKVFLKRYARRYLPRKVVHRRKRGLSVPLTAWLRGPLHEWARSGLASPLLAGVGIDTATASSLLADHVAGAADHARAIWTLLVLREWLEWLSEPLPAMAPESLTRIKHITPLQPESMHV
ncbi:asparagine synthase (glutamine-hydrolyzing) [Oleiagrimonas sp. C23AA]|uniref:asparagine synthase (glutamine-hydrolyzing) n=1 Tax=Oleiagrimonas sp. C23AA TaxID=2719047 RepID=UPI00141E147B|nr:asparagine synthase (glutamine-hydrolyzing) [Oleiagrimonas sp. C23AA]NII11105.1 asparagine synthase (glutamine-hydrolyzing) [Oleiagrimonas sp. C23AA]